MNYTIGWIVRFHYQKDDPRFQWRFNYFKNEVLPRIKNQTIQPIDICVRCNDWHKELFEELGCKTFRVKNEYADYKPNQNGTKQFFYDFCKHEDTEGLEKYDIQVGVDSDDLVEPKFLEKAIAIIKKYPRKSVHICFQPRFFYLESGKTKPFHRYTRQRGSAFMVLYQPDKENYRHIYEESHLTIINKAQVSHVMREGYCMATCHELNESTGVDHKRENKGIKAFWYQGNNPKNVGDTLTPILVEHFTGKKVVSVGQNETGKLLAVGSIMRVIKNGDVVWGAGVMRETDKFRNIEKCKFLAVRGKLSEKILGIDCGVYGDPALLLPLLYNPRIEKKHKIGIIPHYIEKDEPIFKQLEKEGAHYIDVEQDWKSFVDDVLSCDYIISSSLHGVVISESYGIPTEWLKVTSKVIGDGFKFKDYLTGTGRDPQDPGRLKPIQNLKEIQNKLIKVLKDHYDTSI